jgi:hypothetical protein
MSSSHQLSVATDAERLIEAIFAGDMPEVRAAIASGARLDDCGGTWGTPLMHAGAVADLELLQLLIEAGADPNARAAGDMTALITTADHVGMADKRARACALLVEAGANVDATTVRGRSALMIASELEQIVVVRALLQLGASPSLSDRAGDTALTLARRKLRARAHIVAVWDIVEVLEASTRKTYRVT